MKHLKQSPRGYLVLGALLAFCVASFIYCMYGFEGTLTRDSAVYIYGAQQLSKGIPPYVSVIDPKGPLSFLVPTIGVAFANALGLDHVFGVRVLFMLVSCGAVATLFVLSWHIFRRWSAAAFAALTFIGFKGFAVMAAATGPRPKTFSVLFEILCLLCLVRGWWFWAGLCGGVAALTWQPSGILILAMLLWAVLQSPSERWRVIRQAGAGIVLPLLLVLLWFHAMDAMAALQSSFEVGLLTQDPPSTFRQDLANLIRKGFVGYQTMLIPLVLGFGVLGLAFFDQIHRSSWRRVLREEPLTPVLVSLLGFVLWSLYDFQGSVDYYPLLPYGALGFGVFLDHAVTGLSKRAAAPRRMKRGAVCVIAVALLGIILADTRVHAYRGYAEEKAAAEKIEETYGPHVQIMSIGNPELMVLLQRTNPNPYLYIIRGIDRWIHARTPGGFAGWVRQLDQHPPDIIGYGTTRGYYVPMLEQWIRQHYAEEKIGPWRLYVRKGLSRIGGTEASGTGKAQSSIPEDGTS